MVGLNRKAQSLSGGRVLKGRFSCARAYFLGLFALLLAAPSFADEDATTLHVRGEAQLMVSPDQVEMIAVVVTENKSTKTALAANSKAMNKVMTALQNLGIKKKSISTQNFNVQPVWSPRPRVASSDWRAEIIGYRVNNGVQVKTTQIKLIGDMINAATKAGANQIQSIRFSLSNPREYRSTALTQAVENARADAEVTAKAAGTLIKEVKTIHIDQAVTSVEHMEKAMVMRSSMADSAPQTPVNAGDVTVRASVTIVYELNQ